VHRSAAIDVKSKDHIVSRVDLKLKFWKGNYLLGSNDVGRLQDENLKENLKGQ